MNLAIRGISHNLGERPESTFAEDLHRDKKVDFIMANPPFNLKLNAQGVTQDNLNGDARWDGYPVPPVSNANYAWILHMLSKLDVSNGIAGFLLANGALNATGVEGEIRKSLIENDKVEAIIVLPREMFYSTDISVTLWILNNNKKARTLNGRKLRNRKDEVLFIDHDLEIDYASEMARIQNEMHEVLKAEKKSQIMLEEAFRGIGYGIS
jgi:type I restriction enzyme M protein